MHTPEGLPWGGTAFQPPTLDSVSFIPELQVPGTFGSYSGPSRSPLGTSAIPAPGIGPLVRALPNGERRNALVRQIRDTASISVQRASHNARKLAGIGRTVGVRNNR